jgi:hypothetical protein
LASGLQHTVSQHVRPDGQHISPPLQHVPVPHEPQLTRRPQALGPDWPQIWPAAQVGIAQHDRDDALQPNEQVSRWM